MVVAVHQPNFFPWLGYFSKIARSKVFVLLDTVQFPRTGSGTWTNRVKIMINKTDAWATMPVVRSNGGMRRTNEMQIDDSSPWRIKLVKTLRLNYARAQFFEETMVLVEALVMNPETNVAQFNETAIRRIAGALGLRTQIVRASDLNVPGDATDLLIGLVRKVGGTQYLSGDGAAGYQEDEKFAATGLALAKLSFVHPIYTQVKGAAFVPGLSVIDALMWAGPRATAAMIMKETA